MRYIGQARFASLLSHNDSNVASRILSAFLAFRYALRPSGEADEDEEQRIPRDNNQLDGMDPKLAEEFMQKGSCLTLRG
jgi:hypothetical protein